MSKKLTKGNYAFAEAAIRGGVEFYAGYPITPSTEIMEHMASRMPQEGRIFMQAESEIASTALLLGASACGKYCLTASSGPGVALMQEGLSTISSWELPVVLINVQRHGNGAGNIINGQSDYHRDTRGGGQGDYRTLVFSPASIQEGVDLIYNSFEIAEKYRIVVVIHTEAALGQMSEAIKMPPFKPPHVPPEWRLSGTPHPICSPRVSPYNDGITGKEVAERERNRYKRICAENQRWESRYVEDADYVFVAYGIISRPTLGAVEKLRAQGHKVALLRPISLFPYPVEAFKEVNPQVKGYIVVEGNDFGQMVDDAALASKSVQTERNIPIYSLPLSSGVPKTAEIVEFFGKVLNGSTERKY
jgi:2-oxoglutarate ferredoxin oxidoreductase subunit alpha